MGIYVKGANGAFSGKVGSVVGSNWRSINYLRSLPKPSKKAATEQQKAQRQKFAIVTEFLSPVRDLINKGLNDKSRNKATAYNMAVMDLLHKMEGEYPDFTIPYREVRFSKGDLLPLVITTGEDSVGNFLLQWGTNLGHTGKDTDIVHLIFYKEDTGDFFVFQDCERIDGEYSVLPEEIGIGTFHLWVFLTSENGKKRSKSQYIDVFDLA